MTAQAPGPVNRGGGSSPCFRGTPRRIFPGGNAPRIVNELLTQIRGNIRSHLAKGAEIDVLLFIDEEDKTNIAFKIIAGYGQGSGPKETNSPLLPKRILSKRGVKEHILDNTRKAEATFVSSSKKTPNCITVDVGLSLKTAELSDADWQIEKAELLPESHLTHRVEGSPLARSYIIHPSPQFSEEDLQNGLKVAELCRAIESDGYAIGEIDLPRGTVEWLNALLKIPTFFDSWLEVQRSKKPKLPEVLREHMGSTAAEREKEGATIQERDAEILALVEGWIKDQDKVNLPEEVKRVMKIVGAVLKKARSELAELDHVEQEEIKTLNRVIIDAAYPKLCPPFEKKEVKITNT